MDDLRALGVAVREEAGAWLDGLAPDLPAEPWFEGLEEEIRRMLAGELETLRLVALLTAGFEFEAGFERGDGAPPPPADDGQGTERTRRGVVAGADTVPRVGVRRAGAVRPESVGRDRPSAAAGGIDGSSPAGGGPERGGRHDVDRGREGRLRPADRSVDEPRGDVGGGAAAGGGVDGDGDSAGFDRADLDHDGPGRAPLDPLRFSAAVRLPPPVERVRSLGQLAALAGTGGIDVSAPAGGGAEPGGRHDVDRGREGRPPRARPSVDERREGRGRVVGGPAAGGGVDGEDDAGAFDRADSPRDDSLGPAPADLPRRSTTEVRLPPSVERVRSLGQLAALAGTDGIDVSAPAGGGAERGGRHDVEQGRADRPSPADPSVDERREARHRRTASAETHPAVRTPPTPPAGAEHPADEKWPDVHFPASTEGSDAFLRRAARIARPRLAAADTAAGAAGDAGSPERARSAAAAPESPWTPRLATHLTVPTPTPAAPPTLADVDLADLMDAVASEIAREYRRHYGE